MQRLLSIAEKLSPRLAETLLDRFPEHDRRGFQVFSVDEVMEGGERDLGSDANGNPVSTWLERVESLDGGLRSGLWDSTAGRHLIKFPFDEWVHILEGEAHVTALGRTRVLRAGDVAFFRAGLDMTWDVPTYVRKVWVQRTKTPGLAARVVRKLARLVR